MFGNGFVRDYSSIPSDSVNLVTELTDNSLFVPDFQTSEMNSLCVYIVVRYLLSLLYSILCGVNNKNLVVFDVYMFTNTLNNGPKPKAH